MLERNSVAPAYASAYTHLPGSPELAGTVMRIDHLLIFPGWQLRVHVYCSCRSTIPPSSFRDGLFISLEHSEWIRGFRKRENVASSAALVKMVFQREVAAEEDDKVDEHYDEDESCCERGEFISK